MRIEAPELIVTQWFNVPYPISLEQLRGRVVVLHAFQMLCPGCVSHGTPQAQELHRRFSGPDVVVIGLHSVFEHHAAMTPVSLEAFIHEYKLTFPIGVDTPASHGPIPETMARYRMRGTPTTIVIDRQGLVRAHQFGTVDDLSLGFLIGSLIGEPRQTGAIDAVASDGCDGTGCTISLQNNDHSKGPRHV